MFGNSFPPNMSLLGGIFTFPRFPHQYIMVIFSMINNGSYSITKQRSPFLILEMLRILTLFVLVGRSQSKILPQLSIAKYFVLILSHHVTELWNPQPLHIPRKICILGSLRPSKAFTCLSPKLPRRKMTRSNTEQLNMRCASRKVFLLLKISNTPYPDGYF